MHFLFFSSVILATFTGYGQTNLNKIARKKTAEPIIINAISHDSLQSSFVIWIKNSVPAHYHKDHTETIYVLEGKGEMRIGTTRFSIKKGDFFVIKPNMVHEVLKITSRKPLKVLSTQAPYFDGSDRIWINP
ncbi:MAG: cupin domain-containing protein [Flavobacteriales bacterium]